jgi:hypothetical protein
VEDEGKDDATVDEGDGEGEDVTVAEDPAVEVTEEQAGSASEMPIASAIAMMRPRGALLRPITAMGLLRDGSSTVSVMAAAFRGFSDSGRAGPFLRRPSPTGAVASWWSSPSMTCWSSPSMTCAMPVRKPASAAPIRVCQSRRCSAVTLLLELNRTTAAANDSGVPSPRIGGQVGFIALWF